MLCRSSLFLYIKVRISGMKPRIRLWLPLALYPLYQFLLSLDALASLIPGKYGVWSRMCLLSLEGLSTELMMSEPQTLADIDIHDAKKHWVQVKVKTTGLFGGGL